jgi:NAD(P)-dependent dehydrogenase (short-subunit alcohol dehydrogenase family)
MTPALVMLGATGGIGRGVVDAALQAGWAVIAVARGCSGLKALETRHSNADLTLVRASVSTDREGAKLVKTLRKLGRPIAGAIVAVCGAREPVRVLDVPANVLRRRLDEDLLPHLVAARHLVPLLASTDGGGRYVVIGGPGSESPWAGYGHCSVSAAALRMLAQVLRDEAQPQGVRVQLLSIDTPACTEANAAHACPQWPSAFDIGRRAVAMIDALRFGAMTRPVVRYAEPFAVEVAASAARTSNDHTPQPAATPDTPQRDLHDARALLQALTSTKRNEVPRP